MKVRSKSGYFALSLLAGAVSQAVYAAENAQPVEVIVVTTPQMQEPVKVETNPRAPRQPVPAHDGADYLKGIPGFSVIRKGGTDGDPVFRGMAGSRVNILLDGEQILGGCGGRRRHLAPGAGHRRHRRHAGRIADRHLSHPGQLRRGGTAGAPR